MVVTIISILLVLGNFFFVAAEYALIGTRRAKIEQRARKGERRAKAVLYALDNLSPFVAATQIAITMLGIAIGSVTEPFVTAQLQALFGNSVPTWLSVLAS